MSRLAGKRVVFVIAFRSFRDEELLEPRAALDSAGATTLVASSALGTAEGMLGARVEPDLLYTAVRVDDLDALVFVGGEGAAEYWEDRAAHKLAKEAQAKGKLLGAICFAPSTLANAGLLEGRKASCFATRKGHLVARGAIVTNEPVTTDGRLVTA
ncbi:MAG: DJ-1/PfpI family protein, partial [Planctomycetota bacterium]